MGQCFCGHLAGLHDGRRTSTPEGWLYQGAPAFFASVMALLRSGTRYESWDVRAQVYLVMLLKYKAGDAAITRT